MTVVAAEVLLMNVPYVLSVQLIVFCTRAATCAVATHVRRIYVKTKVGCVQYVEITSQISSGHTGPESYNISSSGTGRRGWGGGWGGMGLWIYL